MSLAKRWSHHAGERQFGAADPLGSASSTSVGHIFGPPGGSADEQIVFSSTDGYTLGLLTRASYADLAGEL